MRHVADSAEEVDQSTTDGRVIEGTGEETACVGGVPHSCETLTAVYSLFSRRVYVQAGLNDSCGLGF